MLRNKKKNANEEKVLDVDASMQGSLTFKDPVNLRINGKFSGTLDTKGSLAIGKDAEVNANIKGEDIVVAGKVSGEVFASKSLRLVPPSHVVADVNTPSLSVEEGSVLHGRCQMVKTPKHVPIDDEKSFLEIEDVAHYLEVDKHIVEEWAKSGRIPAVKDRNKWKFERSNIEEWIANEKS